MLGWRFASVILAAAFFAMMAAWTGSAVAQEKFEIVPQLGHSGTVQAVAISPDGKIALSGSFDRTLKLWELATGRELRTFVGHTAPVNSVAFAQDGKTALSGSDDKTLKLWDLATGRELKTFTGYSDRVTSAAISQDGKTTLSRSYAHIKISDLATGRELSTFEEYLNREAVAPDGKTALSGYDNTLKLRDLATGREIRTFTGHSSAATLVAFAPDGKTALSGYGNTLKLWDLATGRELRAFTGHTAPVNSVAFVPNGRTALSGSGDKSLKLWDLATGREIKTFMGHSDRVTSVAISQDCKTALSGSDDMTLKLWDLATGREIRVFTAQHSGPVRSVAFAPGGKTILSSDSEHRATLWDLATGRELRTFRIGDDFVRYWFDVTSVAFAPDGKTALVNDDEETLTLWDLGGSETALEPTKAQQIPGYSSQVRGRFVGPAAGHLLRTFRGHSGRVTSVTISPDGKTALSGSADNTLKIWDLATGRELHTFTGHTGVATSIALAPVGATALSGSSDGTMRLWNIESGNELAAMLASPDGEYMAITPRGFFAASPKAADMLAVVREIETQSAIQFETYSVAQFYEHLHRPDLVAELLKGDPEGKYKDQASRLNLEKILDSGPAPQIEQLPVRKTELIKDTAKITVRLTDSGGGINDKIVWRVNGITQGEVRGAASPCATTDGCRIVTQILRIDPTRNNDIEITAYNGQGLLASAPYHLEINKFGETAELPRMFIVAVGVSSYAKPEWQLKHAADDAKAIGDTLTAVANEIYAEPKAVRVLDKDATAKGIEAAIGSLQNKVKASDVFVLYIAGHGRSIAGTYYFLPQDLQFDGGRTVENAAISQDMLQTWLARIPAQKSILILDTCESASATRGEVEEETAIERLQHATGRSIITASSSSAFEGYQGHGLLTYTILEELTKSGSGGDSEVTLAKLADHVYREVPAISQHVWGVRQQPHNQIADDFPLGVRVAAAIPEGKDVIPKSPTHVLIRTERVRERPAADAPGERELTPGSQVRVVKFVDGGWAIVARDGEKQGYVPAEALAKLQ